MESVTESHLMRGIFEAQLGNASHPNLFQSPRHPPRACNATPFVMDRDAKTRPCLLDTMPPVSSCSAPSADSALIEAVRQQAGGDIELLVGRQQQNEAVL
jgi:hypothetical protein